MKLLPEGIALIKQFEGCKLEAYRCAAGVWTIGWGFTTGVTKGQTMTQAEADARLDREVARYAEAVRRAVKVPLTDRQFSALVCFTFNIGTTAFLQSTLLRKLNQGDIESAAAEFAKWDKIRGNPSKGLARRRAAEKALFLG